MDPNYSRGRGVKWGRKSSHAMPSDFSEKCCAGAWLPPRRLRQNVSGCVTLGTLGT